MIYSIKATHCSKKYQWKKIQYTHLIFWSKCLLLKSTIFKIQNIKFCTISQNQPFPDLSFWDSKINRLPHNQRQFLNWGLLLPKDKRFSCNLNHISKFFHNYISCNHAEVVSKSNERKQDWSTSAYIEYCYLVLLSEIFILICYNFLHLQQDHKSLRPFTQ